MSIRLSPTYGVNPAIPKCFYCGKDKNMIILPGRLPGDVEAPRGAVWDKEPCDECAEWMKQGVILIAVDEKKSKDDLENPWRTGAWAVVRDDFIRRTVNPPELAEAIIKKRVSFVPDDAWDVLGLPREDVSPEMAKSYGVSHVPDPPESNQSQESEMPRRHEDEAPDAGFEDTTPPVTSPVAEEPEWKKAGFKDEREYIQDRVRKARDEQQGVKPEEGNG